MCVVFFFRLDASLITQSLIKEFVFLGFQASTDEPGQPSISFKVIRRFVLSQEFECPFGLQLLANILSVTIKSKETEELSSRKKDGERSDAESKTLRSGANTKEETSSSAESNSTVLYEADTLNTTFDHNETVGLNKKDFFSSENDSSTSSSSCDEETSRNNAGGCVSKEKGEASDREEGKVLEGSDAEEKELEKLLKMAEMNPPREAESSRNVSSVGGDVKKAKDAEESLLDFLGREDIKTEDKEPEELKEEQVDFFSLVNKEIKKAFLLSSDESCQTGEEGDEEEGKEKKEKKQKKKNNSEVKKKDDLSEYRIPNFADPEENSAVKSSSKEESESSFVSSNSPKPVKSRVKRRKKRESTESEFETTDTDSGSDVQQIPNKTESSPSKGRKNIKKILKKDSLQLETKQALKMETERKERVDKREKLYKELFPSPGSKLILDFDPETKNELLVVDEELSRQLKPHQRNGIRFMWNCCFESLKRLEEDSGSGCVLAHCMGLGKTLQVITLVHTVLTQDTGVRTVLVICPLNTIRNWTNEFRLWQKNCRKKIKPMDLIPCRSRYSRLMKVRAWLREGGVMIISYEMFRSLIKNDTGTRAFAKVLLDPGPDMVVCDEGHVLKNKLSDLSHCMSQIKTLRRIILTGTPLQNNLLEYYCMVQFVKPNILGTIKEFKNRFVNPINNGQFEDSTQLDVRLMKRRAHVLHTMLDGFVQRNGYYVLKPFLPEKQEYVISIALTKSQENIYRSSLERCDQTQRALLKDFHWMQKVWTHPLVLLWHAQKHQIEESTNDLWVRYVRQEEYTDIRGSGKLFLLFNIIRRCKEIGDKVLVFSQFLFNLDLIEFFLQKENKNYLEGLNTPHADSWVSGVDYYRLDGSTNSETRDKYCQMFNDERNKRFRLFLVSTKAGGLGISLVAANRVVVFDASWNPTHDVQSIFRVYRFGQKKPCYIYRFLAAATIEEKIYRRQVTKLSLAHRILDEHQIERHYTMGNLQELYTYDPVPKSEWKIPKIPKDNLFAEILTVGRDIIVGYHEHDSLLENKEEEELTEEERRAAWEDYEKEKLTPEQPIPNGAPVGVQRDNQHVTESQVCKILDVRSLNPGTSSYSQTEVNRLSTIGYSFGMKPYKDENLQRYCRRVEETLRNIFPWGPPKQVVRGVVNNVIEP